MSEQQPVIRIEGLSKHFDGLAAVDSVDLEIESGEIVAILGGSGCGKSTLLRMLAGFERPSAGRIFIDGVDMTDTPPYERPVNMMFQSYAVFPHMSVARNIAYGLRKDGLPRAEVNRRVDDMLRLVKLGEFAGRKPAQLSGGQRQRVALARALAKRPRVLLLDEPLAALDKKLREHTQFELANIQYQTGVTFLVVTHDQEEAMTLASRIAVMDQGRFVQVGTPNEIYEYPASRFVADFVGTINIFECQPDGSEGDFGLLRCRQSGSRFRVPRASLPQGVGPLWLAVRPEKIQISKALPQAPGLTVIQGVVDDLAYYGNRSIYRVRTAAGTLVQVSAQNRLRSAERLLEWEQEVYLSWSPEASVVLSR